MKKAAVLIGLALAQGAFAGSENVTGGGFSVDFGGSSLSGAGKLIRATNIPVEIGGKTVYYNLDMDFAILSDGTFGTRVISATPASGPVSSVSVSTMNFLPGTYTGTDPFAASNALPCTFNLANPSIGSDGRRTYVLTVTSTAPGCPSRQSYMWQTGPAEGNAVIGKYGDNAQYPNFIKGASLTYAYGIDAGNYTIRAMQSGNTLTVQEVLSSASPTSRALTITRQ